ncbi:MAG: DNA helicase RecQ [Bacteroidota bacterium]
METPSTKQIREKMKQVFGYDSFKESQEAIIKNVLAGKDTFVIIPTGGGKSLCYQIPALMQEGVAIIISPLIALMQDQVDQLCNLGVNAAFLNSTLSLRAVNTIKNEILAGKIKLLYVAPETLIKEDRLAFLKQVKISFMAVDEAHCISDWGQDFRPEYRNIKTGTLQQLGKIPIISLTATATPKVQLDILKNLDIPDAKIFKSSFDRKNLYYEVRLKEQQAEKQLIKFIKDQPRITGIVYCQNRKKVEEVATLLNINDIKAAPYHAGLNKNTRMRNQNNFLRKEVDVIVATIAFGMGIDKPDVRFVIHYDAPKSLEGYYQETGRAGRDDLPSACLMLYSPSDILKLERLNKSKPGEERERANMLLNEVRAYALSGVCRRKQLLHYFGETYEGVCNYCDNCREPTESYEGEGYLKIVLTAVQQTQERFSIDHIIYVIQGTKDPYTESYHHQKLPIFGKGSDQNKTFWQSVIRQALIDGLLAKDIRQVDILQLTEKGKSFLRNSYAIKLLKDNVYEPIESEKKYEKKNMPTDKAYDASLFQLLEELREKVAQERGVPTYAVLQNTSLEEMAIVYPTNLEDLARVSGLSMSKAIKFGKPFIQLIKKYVGEYDIITASDIVIKSKANRSKNKVYIIQQIDSKSDLEEIAAAQSQSMEELIEQIEHICYSGVKLNLNYYIDTLLTQEQQQEIYGYFMQAKEDSIKQAYKALGNKYDEEEIRLMRIKFLSEVAN